MNSQEMFMQNITNVFHGYGNPNSSQNGNTNIGHGAGTGISGANFGAGAGGNNRNCGPGAGGHNSGYGAGAINGRNINDLEMAPRHGVSEGNQIGAPLPCGGSCQSGSRVGFVQGACHYQQRYKYFFCRFPDCWKKKDLRQIFNKYGVISSIRIPRRRDRYGHRFGFLTFLQVHDREGLDKLDKKQFGSYELRVNPARSNRRSRNGGNKKGTMKVGDGFRPVDAMDQNKIKVDADDEGNKKIIEFKPEEEEKAWLNCSLVGCPRELKDIPMLWKNKGLTSLGSVSLMEGNLVLLRCSNEDDLSTLKDKGRDFLEHHFHWVKPWSPEMGKERYTYIRCEGVPLYAWGERFFKMISAECGRFVSMDVSTTKKFRVDVGRVLIATTSKECISKCFTVRIDSKDHNISVIEEPYQNSDWHIFDGDGSLCKCDDMDAEMQKEKISVQCNVQTAPQQYSLGPKQRQEGEQEVGSSDVGLQEIIGSEPHKNHQPDDLGSQNKDCTTVNGRSDGEQSDGEGSLCNGEEIGCSSDEGLQEMVGSESHKNHQPDDLGSQNKDCTIVNGRSEGERFDGDGNLCNGEEIGSRSDKGFQEIVESEPHENQPDDELGFQNMSRKVLDDSGQSYDGRLLDLDKTNAYHWIWARVVTYLMLSVVWIRSYGFI